MGCDVYASWKFQSEECYLECAEIDSLCGEMVSKKAKREVRFGNVNCVWSY